MPGPRNDACELRFALSYDDLKMNGNAEIGADHLQLAGDIHLQLPRFDDARAGDQEERPVEADVVAAELHLQPQTDATSSAHRS